MIITVVAAVTTAPRVKIIRAQSRSSTEDIAMALLSLARSSPIHRRFTLFLCRLRTLSSTIAGVVPISRAHQGLDPVLVILRQGFGWLNPNQSIAMERSARLSNIGLTRLERQ